MAQKERSGGKNILASIQEKLKAFFPKKRVPIVFFIQAKESARSFMKTEEKSSMATKLNAEEEEEIRELWQEFIEENNASKLSHKRACHKRANSKNVLKGL